MRDVRRSSGSLCSARTIAALYSTVKLFCMCIVRGSWCGVSRFPKENGAASRFPCARMSVGVHVCSIFDQIGPIPPRAFSRDCFRKIASRVGETIQRAGEKIVIDLPPRVHNRLALFRCRAARPPGF